MFIKIYTEETVPSEIKEFCLIEVETPTDRYTYYLGFYFHTQHIDKGLIHDLSLFLFENEKNCIKYRKK